MAQAPADKRPPLPDYDTALATVLAQVRTLPAQTVGLEQALGRVLRDDVLADRDQPPFDRSAMDGFAVRSSEVAAGQSFPVAGRVSAGAAPSVFEKPMPAGKVMRIATGAPLPAEADAMIPIERAEVTREADGQELVAFEQTAGPWLNIHRRGADKKAGDVALRADDLLTPLRAHHVGIAAACGAVELSMARQPRVIVLSTGDEVKPPDTATDALQPQQIRNSNGPMLTALARAMGCELVRHEHVIDEPGPTRDAAQRAAADADLVLTIGGVSVGERDHLPNAWKSLGATTVLHGVAIQPGKPVLAATLDRPAHHDSPTIVLGLPGNPVSVLATAHLFAWPVAMAMTMGNRAAAASARRWQVGTLAEAVKAKAGRQVFRFARFDDQGRLTVLPWQGSGDLMHTAAATCLVRLPLQDEPVEQGTAIRWLPLLG